MADSYQQAYQLLKMANMYVRHALQCCEFAQSSQYPSGETTHATSYKMAREAILDAIKHLSRVQEILDKPEQSWYSDGW